MSRFKMIVVLFQSSVQTSRNTLGKMKHVLEMLLQISS